MSETLEAVRTMKFDPATKSDAGALKTTREFYKTADGHFRSGFWSCEPTTWDVNYDKDELCTLLEGAVRLTDSSGRSETYRKGDTFMIPNGFKGTWETLEFTRKFYAIYTP